MGSCSADSERVGCYTGDESVGCASDNHKTLMGFISCSKKPGKLLVPRHKGLYGYQNSPCVVNNISNVEITKPQSKPKVLFDGIY